MNCNLPKITYSTLRTLLLLQIYQAISQKRDVQVANGAGENLNIQQNVLCFDAFQQKAMLKRVTNQTSIAVYRSAIALQLASESTQSHAEIAYQVVQWFQTSLVNLLKEDAEKPLLRDLTVSNTETGQLEFEFGDWAIARWLETVLKECESKPSFKTGSLANQALSEDPQIFLCQYWSARCSTLRRLVNPSKFIGQTVEDRWLRDGKLLFGQERSLVAQIITTLDHWEDRSALRLAIDLSRSFEMFYRNCQIVKYDTVDPTIAQCRLGLVMITHWLLRQLLEQGLGVSAPETL